jgi:hypothetical protein
MLRAHRAALWLLLRQRAFLLLLHQCASTKLICKAFTADEMCGNPLREAHYRRGVGETTRGSLAELWRGIRGEMKKICCEEKGVRNHCLKYKLWAEVHVWGDRCIPRQRMKCLTYSIARPRIVNNGS